MIISVEALKSMPQFADFSEAELKQKIIAVEKKIRAYTHNNFQNRTVRFNSAVFSGKIACDSLYIKADDNIQISESGVNDGVYRVKQNENGNLIVDADIYDCEHVLVTKVEYPEDVIEGAVSMLKYDAERRGKEGIQSETISRHSVTYFDVSETNQAIGYPISLVSFLKPYMKARF